MFSLTLLSNRCIETFNAFQEVDFLRQIDNV